MGDLYDAAIKRLADYAAEIDRLTARVEAQEKFIAQRACNCPGGCERIANGQADMQDYACKAHDALSPPPGEEPAPNENFDRIMEGMKDAQAWADSQSPRPPSESDVEAVARIIDPYGWETSSEDTPYHLAMRGNVRKHATTKARAILSHLTQAGK